MIWQKKPTPLWRRIIHTCTTRLRIENKHKIHVFRYVKIDERVKWFFLNVHSYNSRKLTDYFKCLNLHFITFELIKHKQGIIKLFSYSITPRTNIITSVSLHVKRNFNGLFFASTLTQFDDKVWNQHVTKCYKSFLTFLRPWHANYFEVYICSTQPLKRGPPPELLL